MAPYSLDRLHGGNVWQHLKSSKAPISDFSANINPLGMTNKIRSLILSNIDKLQHYPEPESKFLKDSLAKLHRISADNILVGNGSIELIHLIPRALKAKKILIIIPTFSEYEFAARACGIKPEFFRLEEKENFKLNLGKIKRYLVNQSLVFLCNPNNPTGSYLNNDELKDLLSLCMRSGSILAIDEAFMDFVREKEQGGLVELSARKKGLLIIRSMTKFFAFPGLRLGYLTASRDAIKRIQALQYPWNVNLLAQAVGVAVLRERDYMKKSRDFIFKERQELFSALNRISGLKVFSSNSNFILCKLEKTHPQAAGLLNKRLLLEGEFVRNCGNFRGLDERFFRVAVKRHSENLKFISVMNKIFQNGR